MQIPNPRSRIPNFTQILVWDLGFGLWDLTSDLISAGFSEHRRLGTADHRIEIGAGGNHRVDAVFLLDPEINQHRALGAPGALHHIEHLRALVHPEPLDAVGL